jgi:hypothetical protein
VTEIYFNVYLNRDSSVGKATSYGLNGRGSIPGKDKRFLSSPEHPDRLWGAPNLFLNGYTRNLPGGGGKGRPARKADNLTAICEPIV